MAASEDYAQWIVANRDKKGSRQFATVVEAYRAARAQETEPGKVLADEVRALNQSLSPVQAFRVGAGRGLSTIARGVGLAEEESPAVTTAFNDLRNRPSAFVGEMVGEATPMLAPGTGVGAIGRTLPRVAAAAGFGAAEGGIIARGRGGNESDIAIGSGLGGTIAGGVEAVSPLLGRTLRTLLRRAGWNGGGVFTSAGTPTPELQSALDSLGIADLSPSMVSRLQQEFSSSDPIQIARQARFEELGIPATRGNITQNFADQAAEERLSSMAGGEVGEPLRRLQLQQSTAFEEGVKDMVDALGVPSEFGTTLKDALTGRLSNLKARKNALYTEFGKKSSQVGNMPVFTDEISEALPDKAELRRIAILAPQGVDAIKDLLVEFGIDQSDEAIEKFTKSGGEVTPLNLGNFETFRQALNGLVDNTTPGGRRISYVVGKLNEALDKEVNKIEESLLDVGESAGIDQVREARRLVSTLKTEFSPNSIVGRLTSAKADGVTPLIEASKAYDVIMGKSQPIEYLQRTLDSLNKAGRPGKIAIGAMQAETVLRALDKALSAPSRKTSGMQTVGYSQFVKSLESVGEDKLSALFADNPQALNRLMMFKGAAEDLTVDARTTPRGSASVIMDTLNHMSHNPGIAVGAHALKFIVNAGADERRLRRAMDARPEVKRLASQIKNDYPTLASALGIASLNIEDDK